MGRETYKEINFDQSWVVGPVRSTPPAPEAKSLSQINDHGNSLIVLVVDNLDYFGRKLVEVEYNLTKNPSQLAEMFGLESRALLEELIVAGIQGIWADIPRETKLVYREARTVTLSADYPPLMIIERGLKTEKWLRKERSLRARQIVQALLVNPYDDFSLWKIRDGQQYPYADSFRELLHGDNLSQLVESSRKNNGKGLVLDFMGYGQVLFDLPLTGGLAVALSDPRSKKIRKSYAERNIGFVEGNVLRSSTWNEIKKWLAKQETDDQRFDLILSRPVKGLDALTNHHKVNIIILQRLWQLLSSQNGVLLTQFRKEVFDLDLVNRWVMLLNRTKGIKASLSLTRDPSCYPGAFKPAISLIKSEGAPEKLPLLSELNYCLQH